MTCSTFSQETQCTRNVINRKTWTIPFKPVIQSWETRVNPTLWYLLDWVFFYSFAGVQFYTHHHHNMMHLRWNETYGTRKEKRKIFLGYLECVRNGFDFIFGYCNCIKYEKGIWRVTDGQKQLKDDTWMSFVCSNNLIHCLRRDIRRFEIKFSFFVSTSHWGKFYKSN